MTQYLAEPDPSFAHDSPRSKTPWHVLAWEPGDPLWTVCHGMTSDEARACERALRGLAGEKASGQVKPTWFVLEENESGGFHVHCRDLAEADARGRATALSKAVPGSVFYLAPARCAVRTRVRTESVTETTEL